MWQSHIELINDLYKIKQIQDSKLVEETIRNHESLYRSSRFEMFLKMGVLKIFLNLKGKQLSWSSFFDKVAGLQLVAASFFSIGDLNYPRNPEILGMFNINIFRYSLSELFCKKGVLRNFAKFTAKHRRQSFRRHVPR